MHPAPERPADWEAFYRDYRKPGYVPGFEITSKLGGGMFGLVFRARRMSIGKDYAIKFLQVEDETVRSAVLNELEQVKYFAQIDHPNLVSIEDRGEVDGIPFLVMAFAGTETLRDKMPAGRVPTAAEKDELLRMFLQCCRGLSALHERSLVHFDIKPANVFLKGGVARLGDYGLSKLVTHSRGSLSMGRGTPYYMAPELLQRRGDARSDVYSLGVMLYEILCGKVPFTGDSEWEVLKQHETAAPELPPHLTPRERAALQRCLAKDPAARYQSVHELLAVFGAAEGASRAVPDVDALELPPCVPPTRAEVPRATAVAAPRRRRVGALAVPVLLVACGFAATLLWSADRVRGSSRALATVTVPTPMPPEWPFAAAPTPAPAAASNGAVHAAALARVEPVLASLRKAVNTAAQKQRRVALADLDDTDYALPRDWRLYREQVAEFAKVPVFSTGLAERVERLGRPAFVAGVAALLDLDYDDADDCRRAVQLHRLLGQMTGVPGLEAAASAQPDCETDVCRFLALADGWRRLAERFGKDDGSFTLLLTAKGKLGTER